MSASFTVRKVSFGEGIERVFPINTPSIEKMEVVKKGKVKRAKLYYLRGKVGKVSKVEEEK
jgi:large subunit ribosomal protein L19